VQVLQATPEPNDAHQPSVSARRARLRPSRPAQWRLTTRLTIAVVTLAVVIQLIVLATSVSGIEERREAELDNAVLVGQMLSKVVDSFASDLQGTSLAMALALGSQPGPLDQASAGTYLQSVAAQYPSLRAMFLTDPAGRLIATGTGGALGFDLSGRPYIARLRAGADTVWSGGISGLQTGETTVAYGRAVRGPDAAPRGYLIVAFYPQQFVESLPVTLPEDARVTVFDDRRTLLYDSDPPSSDLDLPDSAEVQAALAGQLVRIVGQPVPLTGEPRFGALVPISRLGWVVAYTRPSRAVEAALAKRSLAQAGGIALVIGVAAILLIVVARRVTVPLGVLSNTADAIARGERPTIPVLHSIVELDQLATAMRVMSDAVADRETDLIAQRELRRVTLASIGDAVVATDAVGRVTFMNRPAELLSGWTEADALGQDIGNVLDLRNELARAQIDSPIARVLHEGVVVGLANHTILVARDGVERPIDDSAAPIRAADGSLIGVVMVFRDVTERRALQRLQQEFISMVSHELRNPLASIKGYAQLLQRRGSYQERAVDSIIRQSDQLDRLISDLLDASRLEAGRLELRRREIDMEEVAQINVERAQAQTDRHQIRLEVGAGPLLGMWDPGRLDQVFSNLLSNAIKYSPDGGEIVVRVESRDGEAQVSIRDSGLGIEPDQLPKLFDRFYRSITTADQAQGLGVGLYIARELVESHGGRIWATSDGPGIGSTFFFTLPLVSGTRRGSDGEGTVLVVDDDGPLRSLIAEALEGEGYRVTTAGDGVEALEQIEAEQPALILLDWMMPRMDGVAFAEELRRRQPTADLPIVVMTAGGEARDRATRVGAVGFISKPFELGLLLDQVARSITSRAGPPPPDPTPPSPDGAV